MFCTQCNKETINPKFCSRSCSATYFNKLNPKRLRKTPCRIDGCNNVTKSYRHTRCEHHWQEYLQNKLSNKTLRELNEAISAKGKHKSWRSARVRSIGRAMHKNLLQLPCAHCNYDKHVELCHIKAITSFPDTATVGEVNVLSNVIQLCPNCHWEFDNLPRQNASALSN